MMNTSVKDLKKYQLYLMNKEGEKEQAEFLNSENRRMINYHSCQRSGVTLKGTVSENKQLRGKAVIRFCVLSY